MAGSPFLLTTRIPNHFIANVWPLCAFGQMTQYQKLMITNSTNVTIPPMMCRTVLLVTSNGIETR